MASRSEIPAGTVFGRDFEVIDHLASGGMGTVYVAMQRSTGKKRALKVMHGRHEGDDRTRRRFAQEARAGAAIESDHMVEILGAGVDDDTGLPWIAMELLTGQDLKDVSETRGPLPQAEVLEIFRQMCHALAEAHRGGVVHRDLKPENIFLANARREGVPFTVKVLDFGIAKLVAETTAASSQTQAVGSPRWMAPEQADRGGGICPATDVWAMGLIAFQLLTGKCFWMTASSPSPTVMAQVCEILMDALPVASARAEQLGVGHLLPPGFDPWFSRCVSRDIEARYPNAAEAMTALAPILADPHDNGPHPRSIVPSTATTPSRSARSSVATGSIASIPAPATALAGLSLPISPGAELRSLSDHLPVSESPGTGTSSRPSATYILGGILGGFVVVGLAVAALSHRSLRSEAATHPGRLAVPLTTAVQQSPGTPPLETPPPTPSPAPALALVADAAVGSPIAPGVPSAPMPAPASAHASPGLAQAADGPPGTEIHPSGSGHGAHTGHGARQDEAPTVAPTPDVNPPAPHEGEGLLGRSQVQEIITAHTNEIENCFDRGTVGHPGVSGRLVLNFSLGESPHPLTVSTTGLDAVPAVGQCIQSLVRGLTFRPTVGGPAFFTFPLRFSGTDAPGGATPTPTPAPSPTPPAEDPTSQAAPEGT